MTLRGQRAKGKQRIWYDMVNDCVIKDGIIMDERNQLVQERREWKKFTEKSVLARQFMEWFLHKVKVREL